MIGPVCLVFMAVLLHEFIGRANDRQLVASFAARSLDSRPRGGTRDVAEIPRQQVVDPARRSDADVRRIRRCFARKRTEFQQLPRQDRGVRRRIETRDRSQRRQTSTVGSDENKPLRRVAPLFTRHGLLRRDDEIA